MVKKFCISVQVGGWGDDVIDKEIITYNTRDKIIGNNRVYKYIERLKYTWEVVVVRGGGVRAQDFLCLKGNVSVK
jgi:hypothetical protein